MDELLRQLRSEESENAVETKKTDFTPGGSGAFQRNSGSKNLSSKFKTTFLNYQLK